MKWINQSINQSIFRVAQPLQGPLQVQNFSNKSPEMIGRTDVIQLSLEGWQQFSGNDTIG